LDKGKELKLIIILHNQVL